MLQKRFEDEMIVDPDAGTFTVTALGGQRVDFLMPIINPPQ